MLPLACALVRVGRYLRRQLLQQQAASPLPVSCQPEAGAQLLGLLEVGVQAVGERAAGQRRNALVALALVRVNGDGQRAAAQQALEITRRRQVRAAGNSPHLPRAAALGHQQGNLAAGAGLQDQSALKLQGAAQQDGSGEQLAQQSAHTGGVLVYGSDITEARVQLHTFTADVRMFEQESTGLVSGYMLGVAHGVLL